MSASGDAQPGSVTQQLGEPRDISHELLGFKDALNGIRTRRALFASSLYQKLADQLRSVTFGIEHGRYAKLGASRPQQETLRAVAWNIQRGRCLEGIIHTLKVEPELATADLFLLVEADIGMARSSNRNVPREIARALGCDYVFGTSYFCLNAGNARERAVAGCDQLSLAGNSILSRLPLCRVENFSVAICKDKFESKEKRLGHKKALLVELLLSAGPLAVCAVHLDSGASAKQRAQQMADVVAKLSERGAERALIGGDFNSTTYDANHLPALLANLAAKVLRGGFPHAIEHYLYPERIYEKPLFDCLKLGGYRTEGFNELGLGTLRYEVGEADSEGRVRDFLPEFAVRYLKQKLAPYGGVVGLKLDWFAARGLNPRRAGTIVRPRYRGQQVSDHDPIWVEFDVVPSGAR